MTNTTASIDLAQLDKLEALAQASLQAPTAVKAEQALWDFHDEANPATVQKLIVLARRFLTSGAPAEPAAKCAHCGRSPGDRHDECEDCPVHGAAAPSTEQALLAEVLMLAETGMCHGLLADDYCSQIVAKIKGEAGAAAKSEQAPAAARRHAERIDAMHKGVVGVFASIKAEHTARAAGAGSAQTSAEGNERALFEAWAKSVGNNLATDLETGGDVYVSGATRIAWGVWQARAALDQGAQAATTASASDQKPCGWLAGNSHDGGETMYCRREDAQRECDEYNTFERSQPDFDPESLRTPKPVYLAALARAPLPAQGCRWPTCESEKVQQEVADQAYRELYSGEQAQSVDDARDAARREAWLIANHRWSVRWRIHTKKQIEQWQMVDDGEPWGQWGNYRKVIDAAMRANDGAAEGGSQK